jgi:hypothetical protein
MATDLELGSSIPLHQVGTVRMDDKGDRDVHSREADGGRIRLHVLGILLKLKQTTRAARNSVDHTVEVDREKKRSRDVDGL